MAVSFPTTYKPNTPNPPRAVSNRRGHTSPLSQSTQTQGSATQLYEVTYDFPPMSTDQMRICQAITDMFDRDEVIIPVYELNKPTLTQGTPVVASASAFALSITGAPSGVTFKAGQPISISTGGRWYLYKLAADSASGSTSRSLTLTSAVRAVHAVNDVVAINRAYIQGDGIADWSSSVSGLNVLSLTVREKR